MPLSKREYTPEQRAKWSKECLLRVVDPDGDNPWRPKNPPIDAKPSEKYLAAAELYDEGCDVCDIIDVLEIPNVMWLFKGISRYANTPIVPQRFMEACTRKSEDGDTQTYSYLCRSMAGKTNYGYMGEIWTGGKCPTCESPLADYRCVVCDAIYYQQDLIRKESRKMKNYRPLPRREEIFLEEGEKEKAVIEAKKRKKSEYGRRAYLKRKERDGTLSKEEKARRRERKRQLDREYRQRKKAEKEAANAASS